MEKITKISVISVATIFLAGCASTGMPNWCSPGTARQQQMVAEQYDPYPENDVGTPVDGGRPRGYMTPPAETLRARWYLGN